MAHNDEDRGPDVALREGICLLENQVYGHVNGRALTMDVYCRDKCPSTPRPAIVFVHGGAFQMGSSKQFARQATYLAENHNYLAVSIHYRLSQEAVFPAALQDTKCAIRWVRSAAEEYNVYPEHVAVAGGSSGGYLAAMAAVTRGLPVWEGESGHGEWASHANLAIALNGLFDMRSMAKLGGMPAEAVRLFLGGGLTERPELYALASPILHVGRSTPPMLLVHGDQDTTVPCEEALAMHKRLIESGGDSEIEIHPGKGHGWFNRDPDLMPVLQTIERFLLKHFVTCS